MRFRRQNLTLPAGTQKVGEVEYFVGVNASPTAIEDLNNLPISAKNGSVVYVRDVAHVRDGYPPQTNIARQGGRRRQSVLLQDGRKRAGSGARHLGRRDREHAQARHRRHHLHRRRRLDENRARTVLEGLQVVGVPKTIDNDLSATEVTFGFNTAINTATDAIDKLHTTAESHHRVMVVEVMGRDAGWIALEAALPAARTSS